MGAWPSCVRRITYRSNCCKRALRWRPPRPGTKCRMSGSGSPALEHRRLVERRLEHFRRVGDLGPNLGARGNVIAGDHLAVALAGAYHGIDAGVAVDDDLEKRGPRVLNKL